MPRIGSGIQLVGRAAELTTLRSALAAADTGQANAVLLAGDAGVGKSRLLTELISVARTAGATIFTGRCLDVDEAGLPYLPFVEALGQLTDARRDVARSRPVLNRLVPGLAAAEPPGEFNPAMDQLRLFDAVHGLLSDLAADGTVLLAIEDLHWADASTRDLVLFLVSRLYTQRILVVCTLRTDDLHRRHPLRPLLDELSRLSTVDQVALAPFDHTDTVAFVSALADGALPTTTVHKIAERSEGNAFFCEELTAVYGDGAGVPSGLAELLLSRVERLSADARRVVRAVAVASRTASHASLLAVCGLSNDVMEEALRESVQHNVLVTTDGGYTFRHALLREAVYDDLLPGERVRLHAGYAQVVKSQALLAYHSFRSHDLPRALTASVRAALKAAEMGAPGEELRHLEQALELWDVVPDPAGSSGADELSLLLSASKAAAAAGETERAVGFARSAVTKSDELADPELSAEARHQLVVALSPWEVRSVDVSSVVRQAWDLVRNRPVSATRAKVLALCARSWVWEWQAEINVDEVRAYAEEAIDNARQVGAAAVEVDGLVTLAVFAEWEGRLDDAIDVGKVAAERAASIGAFDVELRARKNTSILLLNSGRLREGLALSEFIHQRAAQVGLPWGLVAMDARMECVFIKFMLGEWADALATTDIPGAPCMFSARALAPSIWVLAAQGEFAQVDAVTKQLRELSNDALTRAMAGIGVAQADLWRGRTTDALDRVQEVFELLESLARPSVADALYAARVGIAALAELAERARRQRDEETARQLVLRGEQLLEQVQLHSPRTRVGKLVFESQSDLLDLAKAELAAEFGRLRGHDDPALWEAAVERATGFEYFQATSRWRYAAALLSAGDREKATDQLLLAHEVAARLGAQPLRDAVAALARRGRITLPNAAPDPEPTTDLTPRELAVLELVAAGMTNKQVGAQLYISQKTASVHLSRAMAKLGATNRTEVVSIAHDRGLFA